MLLSTPVFNKWCKEGNNRTTPEYFRLQPEAFGCILEAFHVGFQGLLNLLHHDTNCRREPGRDRKILSNHNQDDNVEVPENGNLAS